MTFIDEDYDENMAVSDDIVKSEEKGTLYFFVFSDLKKVYTWDPVLNTKIIKVVEGHDRIIDVNVDKERRYLFVADLDDETNKTIVFKYDLYMNFSIPQAPKIFTRTNTTYQVYEGDTLSGIAVDSVKHLLFIADKTKQQIVKIDFTNATDPDGTATVLYEGLPELVNLSGIVCDEENEQIIWGNSEKGG